MKKIAGLLMVLLFTIVLAGCGDETVSGKVNEKLKYEENALTVKGTKIYNKLLLVENGENMDLTFDEGHKAILVDISMNTGSNKVDHTNFVIESETDSDITPYEALPSDVEYHKKQNIINFNHSNKGKIEGNLVFSFSEKEIKNNKNTLVITLDGVVFKVPLNLN
ncbi:hypothetical protein [Niallia sp. 01092]|uniref:hypothetical protein n=1 Tax=unclassified Niallia TaxID=2837522 RepID=UPI003FD1C5AA